MIINHKLKNEPRKTDYERKLVYAVALLVHVNDQKELKQKHVFFQGTRRGEEPPSQ